MQTLKEIIADLKIESLTLLICCRDRRVPLYAKIPAILAAGLFFSPIDLIPDFIPVLGHIDDIIIIPLLIKLTNRLVPAPLLADNRKKAEAMLNSKPPVLRAAAAVIIASWIGLALFVTAKMLH